MTVLAIDQGTTSTRGLSVTDDGEMQIVSTTEITQHHPQSGYVEHDARQLFESVQECIDHCPEATRIGIDNQGESCLAWDRRTGEPLTPVIVWQDNRTADQIEKLKQEGVEELTLERAGLPLDSYFSASKLRWIFEHVPAAEKARKAGALGLGTTDTYFLDRLCGRYVTDCTTASRTSLLNLGTGEWDEDLCKVFQIPLDCLPEIVPTTGEFGEILDHPKQAQVYASVVDQQASLYGHGCRSSGDVKITFGTGAFALMVTGDSLCTAPDQGLLPTIGWQRSDQNPVYALDGGVYCAGSALNWAKSLGLFNDWEAINHFDRSPAISRDLAFVPALSGLACPHWDRRAAGLWVGLSLDTDPADLMQSVLEGIAMRAVEVVNAMQQFDFSNENTSDSISIDGGLSVNSYFCQFLSNVLQRDVNVRAFPELTALGTAQLAGATVNPDRQVDIKTYSPNLNQDEWLSKFSEAVGKSRQWRS